jgi:hypothetical protein
MKRRLFNVLTLLSLLCVAAVAIWVRSHRVAEAVALQRYSYRGGRAVIRDWGVEVARGRVALFVIRSDEPMVDHDRAVARRGEVQWRWLRNSGEDADNMMLFRGHPTLGFTGTSTNGRCGA